MNACRILMGNSEGNIPLGRPRCTWKVNIKMDLREIRWGGVDWIDWIRIGTSEHLNGSSGPIKCWESLE
jgi:hypothetical protein